MKESISYTYLLNMMLVFLVISFCVLFAIFSYTKAYRLGSKIINELEKAEGYNDLSEAEIDRLVSGFGYQQYNVNCKNRDFVENQVSSSEMAISRGKKGYCIYEITAGKAVNDEPQLYYYGVTTFMTFDIPFLGQFIKIPVYNVSEKIYDLG